MNKRTLASSSLFFAFQAGWVCLIALVLNSDVSDLQIRRDTWKSALMATTPRLLLDGSLVRLEALLRTETDLPTVVCTLSGKTLVSNMAASALDPCINESPTSDATLIFDSKPVGRLRVLEPLPFQSKNSKYVFLVLIWGMATFLYYSVRRRQSDLTIVDGLLEYMKSGQTQSVAPESPGLIPGGSKMNELVRAVTGYREASEKLSKTEIALETSRASAELAAQVSHDIRSPLAALNAAVQTTNSFDESTRAQIRMALNRIRDIANGLLAKNRENRPNAIVQHSENIAVVAEHRSSELLSPLIESAVSLKRLQLCDQPQIVISQSVPPDCFLVFSEIDPGELHRIISNLLNNSIEALSTDGEIGVSLARHNNGIVLTIRDNGKGIPRELLAKVVEKGGTFGKANGNGLGLSHAKKTIESWGGKLSLESEVDHGTIISIELPLAAPPNWFPSEIRIQNDMSVLVIDDDPLIHKVWDHRFSAVKDTIHLVFLHSPQDLLKWYRDNIHAKNILILCDYEFNGHQTTGLDVLEMTGIGAQSILVTNIWEEDKIRRRCEKNGIKLLPKQYVENVNIQFEMDIHTT